MGYVILVLWLTVWVGFSVYGFKRKWSGVVSVGGGFFTACATFAIMSTVYEALLGEDSDSAKQNQNSAQTTQHSQQPTAASKPKKECDTSNLTIGGCVMQKYDMYDGTPRFNDISGLMQNGNYSMSTRWEGDKCFADVHVSGIANGNSYNTSFSCEVWQ